MKRGAKYTKKEKKLCKTLTKTKVEESVTAHESVAESCHPSVFCLYVPAGAPTQQVVCWLWSIITGHAMGPSSVRMMEKLPTVYPIPALHTPYYFCNEEDGHSSESVSLKRRVPPLFTIQHIVRLYRQQTRGEQPAEK